MGEYLPVTNFQITPTDVSQYLRLDRCDRFLRLRLHDRSSGGKFLRDAGVAPETILPLLQRSGEAFEDAVEVGLSALGPVTNYKREAEARDGVREADNVRLALDLQALPPGSIAFLCQPRLEARLGQWLVRGDLDILRAERSTDGRLSLLIADCKSSAQSKVEYRLQVAFYHAMLVSLLAENGLSAEEVRTAILFRGDAALAELDTIEDLRRADACTWFGASQGLLEIVEDAEAYLAEVQTLVTNPGSAAERAAVAAFGSLHFTLGTKCDGCWYNEFCLKDTRERRDLALVPYLGDREKKALLAAGIDTVEKLAVLKEPIAIRGRALPAGADAESTLRQLAEAGVGVRVDDLVLRARAVAGMETLSYVPGSGHASLPYASAELHPNLISVYLSVQYDYLQGRTCLLGARIIAYEAGQPTRSENVVRISHGKPDAASKEVALYSEWTEEVLRTVAQLAFPDADGTLHAPIHLVFWDGSERRYLLEGLARCFPDMGAPAEALYDLVTQTPAFDSPAFTDLSEELRARRAYPVLCPSLQAVAAYLGFDWSTGPINFRETFRERMFDGGGFDVVNGQGYTRRARYNSQMPLDYVYAAWGDIPSPPASGADPFDTFRSVTTEAIGAFTSRRLEAMEHIASRFRGNKDTQKGAFDLSNLARFQDSAGNLARALREFLALERHASLGQWRTIRNMPPERRTLLGETLLVEYHAEDQDLGMAQAYQDNMRRRSLNEQFRAAFEAGNPGKRFKLTPEQKAACEYNWAGLEFRLRVTTADTEADLDTVLGMCEFEAGDSLVFCERWTYDTRLPEAERVPLQPSPKQMLYGQRVQLIRKELEEADGRVNKGFIVVQIMEARGGSWSRGYVFGGFECLPSDGTLYTLDPDPNDFYGYWNLMVVEGLEGIEAASRRESHALYHRVADSASAPQKIDRPSGFSKAQNRFLEGLNAFTAAGHLHEFEEEKQRYIGSHADDPLLLVQGPPGTGKSYGTGWAVFARLQGAMSAGVPLRVLMSCKTHRATDVLAREAAATRAKLAVLRAQDPALWEQFFDVRLLDVPIFRIGGREALELPIVMVPKDDERPQGEPRCADLLQGYTWCVGAVTPGRVYTLMKSKWDKNLLGHHFCDLLVMDEASQMSLPEAMMAALPLAPGGQLIVVGDPRQMPPIVQHDWKIEARRTFQKYRTYASLFESLAALNPPRIGFARSFRLHRSMAGFLCREVYRHDGIAYFSERREILPILAHADDLVRALLSPDYPLVVVVHDEATSQNRNLFEEALLGPALRVLASPEGYGLEASKGLGVVVPHRAQRLALRNAYPELSFPDPSNPLQRIYAVDTVERYQGDERDVILVSATESDPDYLRGTAGFLLDPRRLTVALSRAKKKMVLVASRSLFEYFSTDEELFANSQIWKSLLRNTCTEKLWNGERDGHHVTVWGCHHEVT